jgi:hypothetical protein
MRVSATSALAPARDAQAARRVGAGSFTLGDGTQSTMRASAGHLQAIGGIDTLVALQGVDDPAERRRRAVRGGRTALDALEALKLGLISGDLDGSALNRLRVMAADLKEPTGDPALDGVLSEIDLRVQVEIAKLSRR